jgi:hypothetical protein
MPVPGWPQHNERVSKMTKSIVDRVQDSFTGEDRDSISKYLDWARSTLLDYSQSSRRMATLLILLGAIFELVAYSRNSSISIGSFVVARGSVALVFLPTLAAYIFFQIATDLSRFNQLLRIFSAVYKIWREKAVENDLEVPLIGPVPLYWNPIGTTYSAANRYTSDKIEMVGSITLMIAVAIGIIAFEAQAYYVLYIPHYPKIISWIISLCVTLFCLIMALLALTTGNDA